MDSRAAALVLALVLVSAPAAVTAGPRRGGLRGADRRREDRHADLAVRLRPVHRAPRPLHLRRHVGRDARGPQVLLPGHRRRAGVGDVHARPELATRAPGTRTSSSCALAWMVIGERSAVTTVKEGAFAGEHSVQVALDTQAAPRNRAGKARAAGRARVRGPHRGLAGGAAPSNVSLVWGGGATMRQTVSDRRDPRRSGRPTRCACARAGRPTTAGSRSSRRATGRSGSAPSRSCPPTTSSAGGATRWRACASSTRPSTAGRAATSSPATTGRTASAIPTAGRRGRTRRGRASRRTTSASTSSWTLCA